MKEAIHPKYEKTTITCACGEVIETSSTKSNIRVEICSKCHPFFTGKQKLVDTGGRVDRFKKRFGMKEDNKNQRMAQARAAARPPSRPSRRLERSGAPWRHTVRF